MLAFLNLYRKIKRIIGKIWIYFLVHILGVSVKQTKDINGVKLTINALEKGGQAYFNRGSYQEVLDPLYQLILKEYNPNLVIDVGANYGFISVLYAKIFKRAKVIAIEPSKVLCKYIDLNKKNNSCNNIEIVEAICDASYGEMKGFSINPVHSQDNRVDAPSSLWRKENVITTSLDTIIEAETELDFAFIKIDTQGFEEAVFKGGEKYLKNNSNWIIKTEFFPNYLQVQGTDPKLLLNDLISNYDVIDLPGILSFKEQNISNLFRNKLSHDDVDQFIEYLIKFNHSGIGWTDLLIKPKS